MFQSISTLFILFFLAGCGGSGGSSENKSESFSYEYSFNGCETGRHSFSSKQAYCVGLADDARNNFCAEGLRCGAFRDNNCEAVTDIKCF